MKKLLSVVLLIIFLLSVFITMPASSYASNVDSVPTGAKSGTTGDCTWTLNGTELTITGNGAMADYGSRGNNRAPWGIELTKITISDGVSNIGECAFLGCSALTEITIPDSVTNIGPNAFASCTGIKELFIPDTVVSIGNGAFYRNLGLTKITVGSGNPVYDSRNDCNAIIKTASGTLLQGCNNSTIPDGVTSIAIHAFRECSDITEITIPNSVKSIGEFAFCSCTGLIEITIPNSVTRLDWGAFDDCDGLTSITVPESVTKLGEQVFIGCDGLKKAVLKCHATEISDHMFQSCDSLEEVVFETDTINNIGWQSFFECNSLKSITIPASMTEIDGWAFCGCGNLKDISTYGTITKVGERAFDSTAWFDEQPDGMVYLDKAAYKYKGSYDSSAVIAPGTLSITGDAFEDCRSMSDINFPDSLISIGYRALDDTAWLNNQPDGVVYAGKVAYTYKGDDPEELELTPGTISTAITAFYGIESLKNVTLPDSMMIIEDHTFSACTSLESINIPDSVEYIGDQAFSNCTSLQSISLPDSVTYFGEETFLYCKTLNSVRLPSSITDISNSAFKYCTSLSEIDIPESVRNIGSNAFSYTGLTSIELHDALSEIGSYAFKECSKMKSVTIPAAVKSIGEESFGYETFMDGGFAVWNTKTRKIDGFTIHGYKGTEAERYAKENDFTFIPMKIEPKPGDADGDGRITPMDVTEVQHYLSTMTTHVDEESLMFADVDKNGRLEIIDTTWLQRHLAGMEIPYTIG